MFMTGTKYMWIFSSVYARGLKLSIVTRSDPVLNELRYLEERGIRPPA